MSQKTFILAMAFWAAAAYASAADNPAIATINNEPLYIDGRVSPIQQPLLSGFLLWQVRSATTLGDAVHILGPAYIAPDDAQPAPRWYFINGETLTLTPLGHEAASDTISIFPQPDCGTLPQECKILFLGRKAAPAYTQAPPAVPQAVTTPAPQAQTTGDAVARAATSTLNIVTQGVTQRMIR